MTLLRSQLRFQKQGKMLSASNTSSVLKYASAGVPARWRERLSQLGLEHAISCVHFGILAIDSVPARVDLSSCWYTGCTLLM